jgi:hypothetical protein
MTRTDNIKEFKMAARSFFLIDGAFVNFDVTEWEEKKNHAIFLVARQEMKKRC